MKAVGYSVLVLLLMLTTSFYGQQPQQPSVKRHPGDVLHYQVKFEGGDVAKLAGASVHLRTQDSPPANQQSFDSSFSGSCGAPVSPGVFQCSVTIPDSVRNGSYQLFEVDTGTRIAGTSYQQDFGVPAIPIENPNTFTKPSKVTVTETGKP